MKKLTLTTLAVATMLFTLSCGNKSEKETPSETKTEEVTEKVEKADVESEATEAEESTGEVSEIVNIKKKWLDGDFGVYEDTSKPNIKQFAKVFCEQYPEYKPNKMFLEYLKNPKAYDEGKTGYSIDVREKNGFASCHLMGQFNSNLDCCYWICDNDHRLVAFWLDEDFEDDDLSACAIFFYDYDRVTGNMTPRPEWTVMIENAVKGFDAYNVELPVQGKDIIITKFTETEDEGFDTEEQIMKWNGQGFILK
jgi:hypothetical protein